MTPNPIDPKVIDPNAAPTSHPVDDFAENLQIFWIENKNTITGVIAGVVLAICAYFGYKYWQEQRELSIASEYATAGNTAKKLKQFAVTHDGHVLSGAAYLRIADEAYSSGKFADSVSAYEKAQTPLKGTPFEGRAKLGLALAKIGGGKAAEGESILKQMADDTAQFKGLRAEAAYHLLSRAAEANKADDVKKYSEQIMQIDPSGVYAQRAMMVRASMDIPAVPEKAPAVVPKQPTK